MRHKYTALRSLALIVIAVFAGLVQPAGSAVGPTIGGYRFVGEWRVSRTVSEYVYRAVLYNGPTALSGATARARSLSSSTTIADDAVTFRKVKAGKTVVSMDTFSFRHDRRVAFDWSNIQWTIAAAGANSPPQANAGLDQSVAFAATVTLDGAGSSDVDGDSLQFSWSFVSRPQGSGATLSSATSATPTFTIDLPGSYRLRLTVSDGNATDSDEVLISTLNSAPVAVIAPAPAVRVGQLVTIDGSGSFDVDGDALTFAWTLAGRPPSSAALLEQATTPAPHFTVDQAGVYVVQLVVHDGTTSSITATATLNTSNTAPSAHAGVDQKVAVGGLVTLDGSASTDADGDQLTYGWAFVSRPTQSAAQLDDPTAVTPTLTADRPGTYIIQLIVSDGIESSAPATVSVSTENVRPIANAGPDQTVTRGTLVALDGTGSADADGDGLAFRWSVLSQPEGSTAALANALSASPSFQAHQSGTYIVQLIVNDGTLDSTPDTVVINTENSGPSANAGDDQSGLRIGAVVTLDGSTSSDPDGQTLTYAWSLTRPAGSSATLNDTASISPSFLVDVAGTYVAQLMVTDPFGLQSTDTVVVNVIPPATAPIVTVEISDPTVSENGPDLGALLFRRSGSIAGALQVEFTLSGNATPGLDFDNIGTSIIIPDGASTQALSITPLGDGLIEGPETVTLMLVDTAVYDVGAASAATLTIEDRNVEPESGLSVPSEPVFEGDVIAATITLPAPAANGGVQIDLSSSAPNRAEVQATLYIPEGERQGFFDIDGIAAGGATITATVPGLGAFTAGVSILTRTFDIELDATLVDVGETVQGAIVLKAPAAAGGARVAVSAESAGIAVQPSLVVIPEGEQRGTFNVTGVAAGLARLIATGQLAAVGSAYEYVNIAPQPINRTGTSGDLITDALTAGILTEEQAFLYRAYAEMDASKLPAEYRGLSSQVMDSRISVEINSRWATLSPTTKAALVPLIMPPIYAGSWGDAGRAGAFARNAVASLDPWSSTAAAPTADNPNPCATIDGPLPGVVPGWAYLRTRHFKIWYRTVPLPWATLTAAQGRLAARNIAAIAEVVYGSLTGLMGRAPDSDANAACNGGDALIDIYLERAHLALIAQVVAYPGGCDRAPSFMWIAPQHALNPKEARALFAHEFMHMVQFSFSKPGNCTEYGWIDEATANWAIDYVFHTSVDNYEHRFFKAMLTEGSGLGIGDRTDLTEINIPLDLGLNRRHTTAFCKGAGYCDYPFFLYIANRLGANSIRRVYEGTEVFDPIASVEYGVGQQSLRTIWHDYSLALYNDFTGGIAQQFNEWDRIVHGIRWTTLNLGWDEKAEIDVTLNGKPERGFLNEIEEALGPRDSRNPGNNPIYRLSTRVVSFKFSDPAVNYITVINPASKLSFSNLKIWAIRKMRGAWQSPEDWTKREFAVYCRDVESEGIDELVLLYSNGDKDSRGLSGDSWLIELDPNHSNDYVTFLPQLRVSNGGCFKWRGSGKHTLTTGEGNVRVAAATDILFERYRPADLGLENGLPFREYFTAESASVALSQSGPIFQVCTLVIPQVSGTVDTPGPPQMFLNLADLREGDAENDFDRHAVGGLVGQLEATVILTCPGGDPISGSGLQPLQFLSFGPEGFRISDDGRTISGEYVQPLVDGGTQKWEFTFTAERQ